jgi:ATP-dependent RNA helicase RhlE
VREPVVLRSDIEDCKTVSQKNAERFKVLMLRKLIAKLRKTLGSETEPSSPSPKSEHPTRRSHDARSSKRSDSQRGGRHSSHGGKGGGHSGGTTDRPRGDKPKSRHSSDAPQASEKPRHHAKQAAPAPKHDIPKMDTAFSQLGLADAIAYAVQAKGYSEPTPIQKQAIPIILSGKDVIGSAQTGTGKTAAFALPILHRLGSHGRMRCLVLEPTRELALQVEEAFKLYGKYTDLSVSVVYGGVGYGKQREDLDRGVDILAATPGRLLDHLEQRATHLNDIEILVLDEVDRMLDMGFLPDVKRIVQKCPKVRQTLFFTATLPPEIASLASWALHNPVEVNIGQRRSPAETVAHAFYPVVDSQKFELLQRLLEQTDYHSVIIFTRTKFGADRIARRLDQSGHSVGVLHSDRSQRERIEALNGFKSGKYEVLVATDIAARGLDIAGVSHVINYDVPENPEDYVHRIGRTGRAQATGDAFTLVTEDDVRNARSIERYIGTPIERKKIEGFEYIYSALFDENTQTAAAPKPASRLHRGGRR